MKGNTINEFMSDLRYNGGPEKIFFYNDRWYLIEGDEKDGDGKTYLRLDEYHRDGCNAGDFITTHWFGGETFKEAVEEFEKSKIFFGKTIYEVEKDIEVYYG